jgi:hypothetical protein
MTTTDARYGGQYRAGHGIAAELWEQGQTNAMPMNRRDARSVFVSRSCKYELAFLGNSGPYGEHVLFAITAWLPVTLLKKT